MKRGPVGVAMCMAGLTAMWLAGCAHRSARPFEDVVKRQEQRPLVAEPVAPKVAQAAQATAKPVAVAAQQPQPRPQPVAVKAPEPVKAPAVKPAPTVRPVPEPEPVPATAPAVATVPQSQEVMGLTVMPTTAPSTTTRLPGGMTVPAPGPSVMQLGPVVTPVGHMPLVASDSMIRREWPISVAYRPSGDVAAGPTWWGEYKYGQRSEVVAAVLEPFEFVVNIALMPVRMIQRPPGTVVIYSPVGPPGQEHVLFGQPEMGPTSNGTAVITPAEQTPPPAQK